MADDMASALRRVLTAVDEGWTALHEGLGPTRRDVRIADVDVEVALAGDRLAEVMLPAFDCHPDAIHAPRVTVGAWDGAVTGLQVPERIRASNPLVRQWVLRRDGLPVGEVDWSVDGMARVANRDTGRHLLGLTDAAALSPWEAGAPLRRQLWWALGPEVLFVHAAAVGDRDGVALVMGASGAGKSTTALACIHAGMGFLSDDYCLVRGDPPVAHLLAATVRAAPDEVRKLGFDDEATPAAVRESTATDKTLLYINRIAPHLVVSSAPVRAVLIPVVGDTAVPALEPLRTMAALRTVAPAALLQMHVDASAELQALRALIGSVPVFRLRLGRDRQANPEIIQQVLSSPDRTYAQAP